MSLFNQVRFIIYTIIGYNGFYVRYLYEKVAEYSVIPIEREDEFWRFWLQVERGISVHTLS